MTISASTMPSSTAHKLKTAATESRSLSDRLMLRWLGAIFAAIIFEGAARKWLLPFVLHPIAFVAKDILAIAFMLKYPLRLRSGPAKWLCETAVAVLILLLPALVLGLTGTSQAAIVNYKNAFVWILFAAHLAAHMKPGLYSLTTPWLAIVTAAMAALGLLQFSSPPDSWINRDAWTAVGFSSAMVTFGATGYRASGTFSFISGMSSFAIFVFQFMLWRFLGASGRRERNYASLGMVAAIGCGITSGSRSSVVIFVMTLALALATSLQARAIFRFIPVAALGLLAFAYVFPDVTNSFVTRWQTANDNTLERATGKGLRADYIQVLGDHPFGVGLGQKTGFGVAQGQTDMGADYEAGFDDGGSNALLEGGIPGLFALGLTAFLCLRLFIRGFLSKDRPFRTGWACLAVVPLYFIANGKWYDHVGTAFLWLSIGIWLSTDPEIAAARKRVRDTVTRSRGLHLSRPRIRPVNTPQVVPQVQA